MDGNGLASADTEEILTIAWLKQREPFDTAARNIAVLNSVTDYLHSIEQPQIIDLGAGTGNQTLFLLEKLTQPARFTLIEQHPTLLAAARDAMMKRFDGQCIDRHTMRVTTQHCTHTVTFAPINLLAWVADYKKATATRGSDFYLFTASALLDLLTTSEMETLSDCLSTDNTALYATLNYTGFTMSPTHPLDDAAREVFETHMTRTLDRGNPLGPQAVRYLLTHMAANTNHYHVGASQWQVTSEHAAFLHANLTFYQQALADSPTLVPWVACRLEQLKREELMLGVMHEDLWIPPAQPVCFEDGAQSQSHLGVST